MLAVVCWICPEFIRFHINYNQVVGGIEAKIPSVSSTGMTIITYSKLHDQVSFIT